MIRPLIRSPARALRRFHRDEEGLVVVLFVLIVFIFAILIALNWNTGRIISAKMRAQAAADQGAIAAATWQSRAVNMITGANMMILRNASAQVSALAADAVVQKVPERWQAAIDACPDPDPDSPCVADLLFRILRVNSGDDSEEAAFEDFLVLSAAAARDALADETFIRRIGELHEFQRRLVESIPDVVDEQREMIADFHQVELILAVPGRTDGRIVPPLRQGDAQSFEAMLRNRVRLNDSIHSGGLRARNPNGDAIKRLLQGCDGVGHALEIWDEAVENAIISLSIDYGSSHYVLVTQNGADEISPSTAGREPFSVFATAVVPDIRETNFLFSGFFDYAVSPDDSATAAAQAETFNGYDERFARRNVVAAWPFRVWTLWGWNWQPRLTRSVFVRATLENDPATAAAWLGAGVAEGAYDSASFGIQH